MPIIAAERCIHCKRGKAGWTPTLCGRCGRAIAWAWFLFHNKDRNPAVCFEQEGNVTFKNWCNRLQRESRKMWERHGPGPQM